MNLSAERRGSDNPFDCAQDRPVRARGLIACATRSPRLWVLSIVLCLSVAAAATEGPYNPSPETLALWHFDEGSGRYASDVVQKLKGTTSGNVRWIEGKFGKALEFDGETGKFGVSIPREFVVEPGQPFTVEVWIRVSPDSLGKTQQILSGIAAKDEARLQMEVRGQTGIVWLTLGKAAVRNARINIADGKWHHLAGVRDIQNKRLVLCVDGVEQGNASCDIHTRLVIPWRFVLGGESASGIVVRKEECLKGAVDELRFSRKAIEYAPRPAVGEGPQEAKVQAAKPIPRRKSIPQKMPPLSKMKIREKEITNSIGMKLVAIPQGDFDMGSAEAWNTKPVHRIRITKPFYMGACEVTQSQFRAVMGFNPSAFSYKAADDPVDSVSWFQAVEFCKRLSAKEGVTYRLPTEAEWEYACRAGTTTTYFFGDDPAKLGEYAWVRAKHVSNTQQPRPVGTRKPNPRGLYDMLGSVSEWCADWYHPLYFQESPPADPPGPDRSYITEGTGAKTHRGDSWVGWTGRVTRPRYTCAFRDYATPESKKRKIGFRVVREIQ